MRMINYVFRRSLLLKQANIERLDQNEKYVFRNFSFSAREVQHKLASPTIKPLPK